MIVDISDILKESGQTKEIKGNLTLENLEFQGEAIQVPKPLNINCTFSNVGTMVLLYGKVYGIIKIQCGLCLKMFNYKIDIDIDARLKKDEDIEDPDIYIYKNEKVDLKGIVVEHILLNIPIKKRCSDDCKGICPICGTDLNVSDCRCSQQDDVIDKRLDVLKQLLSKDN